jgi:hypothetical protein
VKNHFNSFRTVIYKLVRRTIRFVIRIIQAFSRQNHSLFIFSTQITDEQRTEIDKRLAYYLTHPENHSIQKIKKVSLSLLFSSAPVLIFGPKNKMSRFFLEIRPGTFDIDFNLNPMDGWAWTGLAEYTFDEKIDLIDAKNRFIKKILQLKNKGLQCTYIFGTGPSLGKALERSWSDGYRIVCNTIVRDPVLWKHIEPDFIVAGDAIYHFGFTNFAMAFRNDLKARLHESNALFLYPAQFHPIVFREFHGLENQLIPIPTGWRQRINIDLTKYYELPHLGNVLGLMLLPLACTLSKNIYLWGFDGRAPDDKLFWSNSVKHSYPEYLPELQKAHPIFFDHYVPVTDPDKYIRDVQGEALDRSMKKAEKMGWKFVMMHNSWTPILKRRFQEEG